jgi:hypothetical protein
MTTVEFYRVFGDALIDYGKARDTGSLREMDEAFKYLWDVVRDREEYHEREADLLVSSKARRIGFDIAVPFYGRGFEGSR